MKIMIEVLGGVVTNITATQDCSVYLIDHDNIKERGQSTELLRDPQSPDLITYEEGLEETPGFDQVLEEVLEEYENDSE